MSASRSGLVQTVTGLVKPDSLGLTLAHEHLLTDMTQGASGVRERIGQTESGLKAALIPEAGFEPGEGGPGVAASWLGRWGVEPRLDNLYDVGRNWFFYGTSRFTSIEDGIAEVEIFKRVGGGCLVDQTPVGLARDPIGLRKISLATDIPIVMGAGYYAQEYHPGEIATMSEEDVAERIARDVRDGVAGGIKAGVIGEVAVAHPMRPDEEKVLRAAVRASRDTGAFLSVHPGYGRDSVWDVVRLVEAAGGDLSRTMICHTEHRLPADQAPNSYDTAPFVELARTGVVLGIDTFGWETSMRQRSRIDVPNDSVRLNYAMALVEAGRGDQIIISSDLLLTHWHRKHGGHGLAHIPESVVPLMRYKGFTEEMIQQILVRTPARILTLA